MEKTSGLRLNGQSKTSPRRFLKKILGGIMKYRLLTEEQVQEWLQISVATLRTKRSRPGKDPIPYTKIDGAIRYREDLLLKWLDRNTYYSTDEQQERKYG